MRTSVCTLVTAFLITVYQHSLCRNDVLPIRQLVDELDGQLEAIDESALLYKELYQILSQQAMSQVESVKLVCSRVSRHRVHRSWITTPRVTHQWPCLPFCLFIWYTILSITTNHRRSHGKSISLLRHPAVVIMSTLDTSMTFVATFPAAFCRPIAFFIYR